MAVRRIDIAADFNHTIDNPLNVHSWKIYRDEETGCLRLKAYSKAPGIRDYEFPCVEGSLFLVNTFDSKYAYFRHKEFQDLVDKYQITRVIKKNPNTTENKLYCGNGRSFKIFTDGDYFEKEVKPNEDGSTSYTISFLHANWAILETDGGKGVVYRTFICEESPHKVLLTLPEELEPKGLSPEPTTTSVAS